MKAGRRGAADRHREPHGISRIDTLIQQRRKEANTVTKTQIPVRGETDYYGEVSTGLPGGVLEVDAVNSEELASGENDSQRAVNTAHAQNQFLAGRHFTGTSAPYRLPAGVKVAAGTDIDGNLDIAQLPANIPANNVPNIQSLNGTLPIGQTSGNIGMSRVTGKIAPARIKGKIPKSKIGGVNWDDVDGKPPLATKNYVDNVKADIKRWAKNEFAKRGHNHGP